MKITLLYQVSHYIRVKKLTKYKKLGLSKIQELGQAKSPCCKKGFLISETSLYNKVPLHSKI